MAQGRPETTGTGPAQRSTSIVTVPAANPG
jgi:hypothetical protein